MLSVLENVKTVRKFQKGDILYHQGDAAQGFYFLKKGRVRVFMTSPEGVEKTLSTASQGEILGEAAFFDKMPRISSAAALSAVEVAVINEQTLLGIIRENPRLAIELLEIQASRIRQLTSQIDAMTFMQADGRIARLLLQNARESRDGLTVLLTHEEIAGIVGTSRVTVSKILNRFAREGLVKTGYGKLYVEDVEKLSEYS